MDTTEQLSLLEWDHLGCLREMKKLGPHPALTHGLFLGFPGGSVVKNPPTNAADLGSTPGSERSPGRGNGNSLQYSYLVYPMDREAWQATVQGVPKESDMT